MGGERGEERRGEDGCGRVELLGRMEEGWVRVEEEREGMFLTPRNCRV
jgi:hypothetical protein